MRISKTVLSELLFGSFDGAVSVLGVIIGLAAAPGGKIIAAAIGLAVAASISMGFGEWLADNESGTPEAIAMGMATLLGTMIPILPFIFFTKILAFVITGLLTIGLGALIGHYRFRGIKGYIQTYLMLIIAIGVTIAVTLLIPGAGG